MIRTPRTLPKLKDNASRGANLIKHQTLKQIKLRKKASPSRFSRFKNIISIHSSNHDTVFLHVGLGDIAAAFDDDPYRLLMNILEENFETIIAPGFTEYFKLSEVYHKKHSTPKHGQFYKKFLKDSDYRTDDAMKSFLVSGSYQFDDCEHHDSYSKNGCFSRLVDDDVLVLNIGTHWLTCSHFHFFESKYDVDYMMDEEYTGILISDDGETEISQTCGEYKSRFYSFNKPKIERLFRKSGIMDKYNTNGLNIYAFTLGDVDNVIGQKLRKDDYYLVKL